VQHRFNGRAKILPFLESARHNRILRSTLAFARRPFGRKSMHMQLSSAALLIADVVKEWSDARE
jgi:hypothetical protein